MTTIALSTGSLYTYGIGRVFELAAEAGFNGIEILIDQRWDGRQPDYLRRLSEKAGLPIVAAHSPFKPFVPGWPRDAIGRLKETVVLARAVGARVVVAHLPLRTRAILIEFLGFQRRPVLIPVPLGGEQAYRDFLQRELASFEAEQEILVGVENMPAHPILGRPVEIHWLNDLETLSQMPHLTLDTTHLATWGLDILAVYERLKERVVHVHLSDFDGREHRLPEGGHLPLDKLLQRLQRDGYGGAVSVELGPDVLQAEDERQVRAHLRRIVTFCQAHSSGETNPV